MMHEITHGHELYPLKWAVHSGEFEAMLKYVGSFKVKKELSIIDLTHSVINHPIYFFHYIHHSFSFISLLPRKSQ